ncbi:MAG: nucleotidyl transferase AbiEii/AbiGii toxin family protein [Candidatus Marinimicrobia bacterium]|nr:nucleotidyl transferase AbiEii/AbiGii toxin family protein [Candidatus Neomarinimicrobiota bacterium]
MIEGKCFTKEWVGAFRKPKDHKSIQLVILEKMIYALHLLEQLVSQGLDFVFKGGASLVLLLNEENRFSVDIDIICSVERKKLEATLDNIVKNSNFASVALDEKRSYKPGIPKAHYVFEFDSVFDSRAPVKLLLDILIGKHVYPEIISVPIATKWTSTDSGTNVRVPSIDSIVGDKLTAFAPNTIGIPYYKGKDSFSMEICKQLFDLSKLFSHIKDLGMVNRSYKNIAADEIGFRSNDLRFKQGKINPEVVLRDTIDTCFIIAKKSANKEEPYKTYFMDLSNGIRSLGANFLMRGQFRIDEAVVASAQVAYLAAKLLKNDLSPIDYYQGENITGQNIENQDWNYLNKLKRQPDKSSFYYWYKTVELLKELY